MAGYGKFFLVTFIPGVTPPPEGNLGDGRCLVDCLAMEEGPSEYRFIYGFHTDTVPKADVVSCREISRKEAEALP